MKFKDQNGNEVDTDQFPDAKALVYERLAVLHEELKQFGLSFVFAVKYDHSNVVGSMFLEKGMDFADLIEFIDERLQETTDGDFALKILKTDNYE
jgi:hypothetical protein